MRRDMDVVRQLLLQLEEERASLEVEGCSDQTVLNHLDLMEEGGLIKANVIRTDQNSVTNVLVERITWQGHDFLDAARSEEIWNHTKKIVSQKTGTISFELLKLALVETAKVALRQAGLPI